MESKSELKRVVATARVYKPVNEDGSSQYPDRPNLYRVAGQDFTHDVEAGSEQEARDLTYADFEKRHFPPAVPVLTEEDKEHALREERQGVLQLLKMESDQDLGKMSEPDWEALIKEPWAKYEKEQETMEKSELS